MEPELITSKFGFVENAEIINSRAAMVRVPLSRSSLHGASYSRPFSAPRPVVSGNLLTPIRWRSGGSPTLRHQVLLHCTDSSMRHAVRLQLGFFGILLVEFIAGKGIFEMIGLNVGNGLGFEF